VINWLFAQIEQNPAARFSGHELRYRCGEQEFLRLQEDGLVQLTSSEPPPRLHDPARGRVLTVLNRDGECTGHDEDDPESDPVLLRPADWAQFGVDLQVLARRFQAANGLDGTLRLLTERLLLLGIRRHQGLTVPVVLALFADHHWAMDAFRGLPSLVEPPWDRIVVVGRTLRVSTVERLALLPLRVYVASCRPESSFALDLESALEDNSAISWVVQLTADEDSEFAARGFKSRLPILIESHRAGRGYTLLVGGRRVELPLAEFQLFFRLYVGCMNGPTDGLRGTRLELCRKLERDMTSSPVRLTRHGRGSRYPSGLRCPAWSCSSGPTCAGGSRLIRGTFSAPLPSSATMIRKRSGSWQVGS
jgi:hypothetical protein